MAQIPKDVAIYRTHDLSLYTRRLKMFARHEPADASASEMPRRATWLNRALHPCLNFLKKWVAIPDPLVIWWVPFAVLKGLAVCRSERIDLIYATAPPFSNHVAAAVLKWLTQKPLVIDFRDAWIANPMRKLRLPQARRRVEARIEHTVIRQAAAVVCTTDGMTQDFRARYPHEPPQKFVLITNGYDREDVPSCMADEAETDSAKMRIVHTGNLTAERSPRPFLESLRRLLDTRPDLKDRIEVVFVGKSERFLDGCRLEDYLSTYELHHVVKLPGYVSRAEAIAYQCSASILLLLIGVVPKEQIWTYGIASKLYDYMLTQKPIMTLADPGPVSDIVERTNMGVVLEPSDVDGMTAYLSNAFDLYTHHQLRIEPNLDEINKYDIQILSGTLTELFDAYVSKLSS
jgi:glycosyltransferase involved in cell wall biosynthesis